MGCEVAGRGFAANVAHKPLYYALEMDAWVKIVR